MGSMTFAEAAEHVLREAGRAMRVEEIWAAITKRGLVETEGETPEATLQVELARRSANSSVAKKIEGPPRFYRRGDGAYGLWAHLASAQQRAVIEASRPAQKVASDDLNEDLDRLQEDPDFARRVFESVVPEDSRPVVAMLFAQLISDVHKIHPGCWKLTVRPADWRLVVGSVRVVKLSRGRLALLSVSDLKKLAPTACALLQELASTHPKRAPKGMDSIVYRILPADLEQSTADAAHGATRPVAMAYAKRAHGQVHNPSTHSPGGIKYLARLLRQELPDPEYTVYGSGDDDDDSADRKIVLAELLGEYIEGYLATSVGQKLLASYESERQAARAHFERIKAMKQQGLDVTDAVLRWMLPHTNTAEHHTQGVWIHHAAVIHRDIRSWFEGAGWVRAQDWPGVAQLVLNFLEGCIHEPGRLARTIAAFTLEPLSKGFGVGMLTPILNALAPKHFPFCNGKVARVVSYFSDVDLEATFDDYPALIERLREVVAAQPRLHNPALGARAEDVFDHFCYWLVAIRQYAFPGIEEPDDDSSSEDEEEGARGDGASPLPPEPPTLPEPPEPQPPAPPYTIDDALGRVFLTREELERLRGLLEFKQNLVLQGPPGVGKTFVAAELAYVLLGAKDERRIKRVQFHQSYAYEDFVRGYRPREGGGFEHRDGPMFEFCERARRDADRPYVMIIDEINRGNLSKILGELMLLIEPDKREPRWAVALAYARPGEPPFWVPPNLFIIGTMNTADRSLALVDYALRRRFAFAWVMPAFGEALRAFLQGTERGAPAEIVDKIFARIAKLNAVIEQDARNLGRGYVVGHSYFCQEDRDKTYGATWYERIVRFEIEPLLEEYYAEEPDKVKRLVEELLG